MLAYKSYLWRDRAALALTIVATGVMTALALALPPNPASTQAESSSGSAPAASAEWLTYLSDHSRTSASNATIGSLITPRWTHVVSGMIASEPVIADNRVYVTAWDGYLYALDAFDGQEIWRRYLGAYKFLAGCPGEGGNVAGTTASPTLDRGTGLLYVAAFSATVPITKGSDFVQNAGIYLYALDPLSGTIAWQASLSSDRNNYAWSSPLIAHGHAYVGNASAGDCPLTQGELVSVDLGGAHDVTRVAMAPDSMTVYPMNLVTSSTPLTSTLLPDRSDYNFTATATIQFIAPLSASLFMQLRHAITGTVYHPQLQVGGSDQPCNDPNSLAFVQDLGGPVSPDANGNIVVSATIALSTTAINDLRHALVVPNLVPCARFEPGIGGGIWSSPMYDPVANRVFVTTGTPTPPCVQRFAADCTGAPATIGKRSAAIVAVNADTLAVDWSWQVPFSEQAFDADFGATPTLCGADNNLRVVGVANKDGIFYAFNADALGAPIWQRTIAVGGGGPESAQGSISSAACAGGVFYVGAGKPPDGALVCASDTGQVWALSAATGEPRWRNPHCTGLVIGPVTAASGLLIVGANCRNPALTGCERQLDVLDMATGNTRYRGTSAELSGLGDIVSGAAVVNRLLVVGDGVPAPPENGNSYAPYFPLTGTVRALNAQIGVYLPTIER